MLKRMAMVLVCVAMMVGTAQAYNVNGDGVWTEGPFAFTPSSNGYWNSTVSLGEELDIAYDAAETGVAHVDTAGDLTSSNLAVGKSKRGLLVVDGDYSCAVGFIGRGTGHGKVLVRAGATFTASSTQNVGFNNSATPNGGRGEFVIEGGTVTMNVAGPNR